MVKPVDRIVGDFIDSGADFVTIHPEATDDVHRSLSLIREGGVRAGLSLNPGTPVSVLDPVLDLVDLVLVMSVNPGFGGQSFLPRSLEVVRAVRQRLDGLDREVRLEIDGGIKVDNIGAARAAGADTFVAGSAIFGADDYARTIAEMRAQLD